MAVGALVCVGLMLGPGAAEALSPVTEFSLRDGPVPDGTADEILVAPDPNFGRVFQSPLFDAETYLEFSLAGATTAPQVLLALELSATDFDLVLGESKTFELSSYAGTGAPSLAVFEQGSVFETITLPTNGLFDLELDVTSPFNEALAAGGDFLGIRIHDPVWTGTLVGAGTLIFGSAELTVVPEPATASLLGLGLAGLAASGRRRRSDSPRRGAS